MSYYAATEYRWGRNPASPTGQSLAPARFHAVPTDAAGQPAAATALCGFRIGGLGAHDGSWESTKLANQCPACRELIRQTSPPTP